MNPLHLPTSLAFGMPGGWEWIIIALIALLLFGRRLPEVARSVGDGIREFKKGVRDIPEEPAQQPQQQPAGYQQQNFVAQPPAQPAPPADPRSVGHATDPAARIPDPAPGHDPA